MNSESGEALRSIGKFCLYAVIELLMPIILLGVAMIWIGIGLPFSGLHLVILIPVIFGLAVTFVMRRRASRHG